MKTSFRRKLLVTMLLPLVSGCGGSQGQTVGPGHSAAPPAVVEFSGTVNVPASGGSVALPSDPANNETISATFPSLPAQESIAVTTFTGLSGAPSPTTNIWSPACPWPIDEIQLVFASGFQLSSTPAITFASDRIQGNPAYYYIELFDADSSPVTVTAQSKISVSSSWPPKTAVLPSLNTSWQIIQGHRNMIEIVASTDPDVPCTGT